MPLSTVEDPAIGDGSGVTHSLSQASASGVYVARILAEKY